MDAWRKEGIIERALWTKAGEAGLLGLSTSADYGGIGGDFRHEAVLIEETAWRGIDGWGVSLHNSIVMPYIESYGSEDQKKRSLPKLASGEYVGAIAMTEPGTGSDLQAVKTDRPPERQSIRDQRVEDLHHQRPDRQFHHRRLQDRSDARRQGNLADRRRDRRGRRFCARPQSS